MLTTPTCPTCVAEPNLRRQTISHGQERLFGTDGVWYCKQHCGRALRQWPINCSHSLGFGLGECSFCGVAPKDVESWRGRVVVQPGPSAHQGVVNKSSFIRENGYG